MSGVPAEIRESAIRAIRALPQADVVMADQGRVDRWIESAYLADPDRVLWHIARARGISASEIAVPLTEVRGGVDPFDTMHSLVRKKLFMAPLEPPSANMEIGTVFEPVVRERFHKKFQQFGCRSDEDALETVRSSMPAADRIGEHPWLIGAPDDLVLMNGRRFVTDFMVTMSDYEGFSRNEVALRYVANLHHSAALLDQFGIRVDGLILVPYVRNAENRFELMHFNIKRDPGLIDDLLAAGDRCWQHVMDGEVPSLPMRADLDLSDPKAAARLASLAEAFASYDAVAGAAYRLASDHKRALLAALEERRIGDAQLVLGGVVSATVTEVLDAEKLAQHLGDRAAEARRADGTLDTDKLIDLQATHSDVPLKNFIRDDVRLSLMRSAKSPLARRVRGFAEELVDYGHKEIMTVLQKANAPAATAAPSESLRKTKSAEPAL